MITGIAPKKQSKNWKKLLAEAFRHPEELLNYLQLDVKALKKLNQTTANFRLLAPRNYVKKIEKGNWHDPLLRQILPLDAEADLSVGFQYDPVGDLSSIRHQGILHKYQGRVLLMTTGACAIHCRYCFRRYFPYSEQGLSKQHLQNTLKFLSQDSSIHEVILSGGDPLILADHRLVEICKQIAAIPHIKRLRFHTRLPIILPERIDNDFLHWFGALNIQKIIVIHANHANEFDAVVSSALYKLKQRNAILLNQSVLLKGINDNTIALKQLSEKLIENQVVPYYLHLLDRVQGTKHFEVAEKTAIKLIHSLQTQLSGYMIPKLVREIAGEASKTTII